jgi:hypothetical protein
MLAEMSATELQEWRIRAILQQEVDSLYARLRKADPTATLGEASRRIAKKYSR